MSVFVFKIPLNCSTFTLNHYLFSKVLFPHTLAKRSSIQHTKPIIPHKYSGLLVAYARLNYFVVTRHRKRNTEHKLCMSHLTCYRKGIILAILIAISVKHQSLNLLLLQKYDRAINNLQTTKCNECHNAINICKLLQKDK